MPRLAKRQQFKDTFYPDPGYDIQIPWLPDNGLNKLNSELYGMVIRQTPVVCKCK